jgi:hypothetical protein
LKETIILNWDYKREDLTSHLYELSKHYEIVFLYYYSEKNTKNGFKVINWNDFKSAKKIINHFLPAKIIFHDEAQSRGIETIIIEHGLRSAEEVNIQYEKESQNHLKLSSKTFHTFLFLISCFNKIKILELPNLLRLVYFRKKYGLTIGLHKAQYDFRKASKYINFTETNATYIIERDGVSIDKFIFIGNPQFDSFFNDLKSSHKKLKQSYILLVDSPFEDDTNFNMKENDKIEFYIKIRDFCKIQNKQLIVKLHPRSYHRSFNLDNIIFDKLSNVTQLISQADACIFIHNSGLLPISLLYTKTILFNTYFEYNKQIVDAELINIYDFYNFDINKLYFKKISSYQKENIINTYFYKIDGKANERMINAILS